MINLYITRHGETQWNIEHRMQGWKDSPLTELGITQAQCLGDKLKNISFETIYSSPSGRAYETAVIIRGNRDINIIKDDNLREINLGHWEGKTAEEIEKIDKEQIFNFWNAPHLYEAVSGENFEDVKRRVLSVLDNIIRKHDNCNILVVTHTVFVKMLMLYFQAGSIEKIWEPPFIHQTSLSMVHIDKDKYEIKLHGDTSHYR